MHNRLFTLVAVAACGCGPVASINMSNPLVAGSVPQNRILRPDAQLEGANGMQPGSLVDEATLASLDASKVCFNLVMQVDGAHVNLAAPQAWRADLSGEPYFTDFSPTFSEISDRKQDVREGEATQRTASTQKICDDHNENCVTKTRVDATAKAVNVNVSTGTGAVCFANNGHITKATQMLTLSLHDPGSMSHRVVFQWLFNDAQPASPGAPASAPPAAPAGAPPPAPASAPPAPASAPPPAPAPPK